jgi:hypothetical protein
VGFSTIVWTRTLLNVTAQFGITGHVPDFKCAQAQRAIGAHCFSNIGAASVCRPYSFHRDAASNALPNLTRTSPFFPYYGHQALRLGSMLDVGSPGSNGSSNDWSRKDEDRSKGHLVCLVCCCVRKTRKMACTPAISTRQVPLSSKSWFWLSSAWMALARLGKAAP